MKPLISAIGMISLAGVVLYTGATGAFFTDSEVSTGNMFTAGNLSLSLDSFGHVRNGVYDPTTAWLAGGTYGKFFSFENTMPGDRGVRHLSLHNDSTIEDSYLCLISQWEDENTANEIQMFAWKEKSADMKYNPAGAGNSKEVGLTASPLSLKDFSGIAYADKGTGTALASGVTEHISVAWCAGTMTINPSGDASKLAGEKGSTIECSGEGMTTQSKTYRGNIAIYAEQVKNNTNFTCAAVNKGSIFRNQ